MAEKSRLKFVGKVIGLAVLGAGFFLAWGLIIANQYGVSDAPVIILSSVNTITVIALAFFTYSYMKSTEAMANEMKMSREMEFEFKYKPWVIVDFQIRGSGMVYVVVTNDGNGAARNVRFHFEPALKSGRGGLENWPALQNGIAYLAPKKKLSFFFDSGFELFKSKLGKDFTVTIEYEWAVEGRPKIIDKSPLQLSPYLMTDLSSYKDESTLIEEVEKIRKTLENTEKKRY